MNDFHFLRPYVLLLLLPCMLMLWMLLRSQQASNIWHKVCSKELMPYILTSNTKRFKSAFILFSIAYTLMIAALAGPSWQEQSQPMLKTQSGLIIALDLSPAMDAEDIKPSRLKRALYKINDLLSLRQDGQTALLVYSKEPFVVTPLTDDIETIKALLPALETQIMPAAGHQPSKAIAKAAELLSQAGLHDGAVLLVTAELSAEEREKAIAVAQKKGIRVFVLAVGTSESIPIAKPNGGFVTDDKGALIITTLAKDNLKHLATASQGRYTRISLDDSDIHALARHLVNSNERIAEESAQHNAWHDQGYLLAIVALPFVALFFRRGIFLSLLLLSPQILQAWTWDDLWHTPDQQAARLFQQEQYQEAQDKFQNPEWQGAAKYKMEDYESAAQLFAQNPGVESLYNYGTAKAKQGDFKAALEAYQKVLAEQPDHEDALYNKKLIEDMQQQQKQQQNNGESSDQQDKQQNEGQEGQQNAQDNGNSQKQQNKQQDSRSDNQKQEQANNAQQSDDQQQQSSDKQQSKENNAQQNQQAEGQKEYDGNLSQPNQESLTEEAKEQYRDQITEQLEKQEAEQPSTESVAQNDEQSKAEQQRHIDERWLQRVPDDPGGLLRRKFQYQYKMQQNQGKQR